MTDDRTPEIRTVDEFNGTFDVGDELLYHPIQGDMHAERVVLRSKAWPLGHGAVVAKVTGHAGGVLISHLQAMPPHVCDGIVDCTVCGAGPGERE